MATPAVNPIGSTSDYSSSDALQNFVNSPDYTPVVPDSSNIDLPGQFPSMPGGDIFLGPPLAADPSGVNVIATNPTVNPNPTGNWQGIGAQIIGLAQQGMRTFSAGSPSTAIPPARRPINTSSIFAPPGGATSTKWLVVGGVVVVGIAALFAIGML